MSQQRNFPFYQNQQQEVIQQRSVSADSTNYLGFIKYIWKTCICSMRCSNASSQIEQSNLMQIDLANYKKNSHENKQSPTFQAQILDTYGSDSTNASQSPTNAQLPQIAISSKRMSESDLTNSNQQRRQRGNTIYQDIYQKKLLSSRVASKRLKSLQRWLQKRKLSLNLSTANKIRQNQKSQFLNVNNNLQQQNNSSPKYKDLTRNSSNYNKYSSDFSSTNPDQWKANLFKYGYYGSSNENEVSEIQEEPDEDIEEEDEGFSNIIDKVGYDFGNAIQTEGIEIEEVREEDLSLFERGIYSQSGITSHSMPHISNSRCSLTNKNSSLSINVSPNLNVKAISNNLKCPCK